MSALLHDLQSVLPLDQSMSVNSPRLNELKTPATDLLHLLHLSQLVRRGVSQLLPPHYSTTSQDQLVTSLKEHLERAEGIIWQSCSTSDVYESCCAVACLAGLGAGLAAWSGLVPKWVDLMLYRVECQVMEMAAGTAGSRGPEPRAQNSTPENMMCTDTSHQVKEQLKSTSLSLEFIPQISSETGKQQPDLPNSRVVPTVGLFKACLAVAVGEICSRYGRKWEQRPSQAVMDCFLTALLDFCLPLDGVFNAARAQAPVAGANEWLRSHGRGPLELQVWSITQAATGLLYKSSDMERLDIVRRIREFCLNLHEKYQDYLAGTSHVWIAGVDAGLVGIMLGRVFHCSVKLLSCAFLDDSGCLQNLSWCRRIPDNLDHDERNKLVPSTLLFGGMAGEERMQTTFASPGKLPIESSPHDIPSHLTLPGALALLALDCVAHLQFCRMPSSEYLQLLQVAIGCATTAEARIAAFLLLPNYDAVVATVGRGGVPIGWNSDPLLAGRMVFLMRVFPALLKTFKARVRKGLVAEVVASSMASEHAAGCIGSLAPFLFLFLHHNDPNVRKSAHTFFCVLIDAAWESALISLIEKLIPFYLHRSLEHPELLPWELFSASLGKALHKLPDSSPVSLHCVTELAWAVQQASVQKSAQLNRRELTSAPVPAAAVLGQGDTGSRLFEVLCRCLLWLSAPHAGSVTEIIERVLGSWRDQNIQIVTPMKTLYDVVAGNNDYTRRLALVRWYIKLRSRL